MTTNSNDQYIVIRGAKEHNLKNLNVSIPRNQLVVITGLSGSGKSTLAFDTIFSEGQRRYIESLSTFARQFMTSVEKPDVESIDGLSPTVSIQQKTISHNPRSTVGTVTEIYDYLRLMYARIGKSFCHQCGKPISSQSAQMISDQIYDLPEGSKLSILSPVVRGRKGEYAKELAQFQTKGFAKVKIDGEVLDLNEKISLDKNKKHDIDVYIDRLIIRKQKQGSAPDPLKHRIQESVEIAIKLSEGLLKVEYVDSKTPDTLYSTKNSCVDCGVSYPDPEPRLFSFNSPMGACEECDGLGYDADSLDETKDDDDDDSPLAAAPVQYETCTECNGTRLNKTALSYKLDHKNIAELCDLSVSDLNDFFKQLKLTSRETIICDKVLKEIKDRLRFLLNVGVNYLSLSRPSQTLSGGESQRIRLASQIGSSLTGVIYVLDEPSIGLHQRDNDRLLDSLKELRERGNSVLVVEHDRDTMEIADHIIDMGPGAGIHGGTIVAEGNLAAIKKSKDSLTAKYINNILQIPVPKNRRKPSGYIQIDSASGNNLKNVSTKIPLGALTCVTGVSGSGKSTLIIDTLYPYLMNKIYSSKYKNIEVKNISGFDKIDKVIDIDQTPIGRTPRSNPSTYTGIFDYIRNVFSELPESKIRGFKPGRFSFNVKGGRCETCQGAGSVKLEMVFLADTYVRCDSCNGKRFNDETLSIRYKGKNISEILNFTIDEAVVFFENHHQLLSKLKTISSVGLGYITLGQSSTTLSGGEAQRLKLSTELSKRASGNTFYILDEPSTGLHFEDIRKLVELLHQLAEQGNSVLVIEHNLDIIKTADHIIDLGPEGGVGGGQIVAEGTPEEVAYNKNSITGKYLKPYL